jgi:NDP-sugar pyrophosphorylase family protein
MTLQAVILCGGRGERLRPLTDTCQKCLLPVGGRPFLDLVIKHYADYGIRRFMLMTGYLGEQFPSLYREWGKFNGLDFHIPCLNPPEGTVKALLDMKDSLDNQFLLLNGDTFCPLDPAALQIPSWSSRVAKIAMATRWASKEMDDLGVRMVKKALVTQIEKNSHYRKLRNIEQVLLYVDVAVQEFNLPWIDIGTPENYERAKVIFR